MNRKFFVFLLLLFPFAVVAQKTYPYEWQKERPRYVLTPEEEQFPEIILKDHIEFSYVSEENQSFMYAVYHRIVRVNNNEAIQRHNRIRIAMDRSFELVDVKARSINSQGKVVTFDNNNLKEVKEEESGNAYRIFAMEGVELGSEVEYYFIRKMMPSIFNNFYFQMDVPVKHVTFILKSPKHLEFDFKSYNGVPEIAKKNTETENIYELEISDLPPAREEPFAYHVATKSRIEYKLAYNTARSRARMYTWDDAGKNFYDAIYTTGKDDGKNIEKFVKTLKDDPSKPLPLRIRNIERQIKSGIQLNEERNDEALSDISAVAKYKVASKQGMTRFFVHTFKALNIQTHLVLTCSREYARFDETFDTWNYLDEYLLFFPETNGFMSPYKQEVRYPIVEPEFTSQKGLFVEPVEIGSLKSGLSSVRDIPASPYELNTDNLDIKVDFSDDLSANQISMKREFKGNNASFIAPFYHLMSEPQRVTMVEELLKQTAPGPVIKKWTAGPDVEGEVDKFDIDVDFSSTYFVERAGPRILFKVGLLIGPQTELYQDDKRVNAVENNYNRGYERVIKVNIPAGYQIRNPDDMKFDVTYKDGDSVPFLFQSTYTIEGQVLTLTINEYYKTIYAPLERYEDYRKVINAAADFNKVTLVFEKKPNN